MAINYYAGNKFTGIASDTKPTSNIIDGSTFFVTDTEDLFMYDLGTTSWKVIAGNAIAETFSNKTFGDHVTIAEISAPGTPAGGYGALYIKSSDSQIYFKNDGGTEFNLTEGQSEGGEANQNAYASIAVSGQSTISADGETDTVTFIAGSNITITTNASSGADEVTFASSTITVSDNDATNENNLITFVAGAGTNTGSYGIEMDSDLHYNPSTGTVTATVFVGALTGTVTGNVSGTAATVTGAAQTAITSVGTLTGLDLTSGDKTIFATIGANTLTIGASTTTVNIAGDLTVSGDATTFNTATVSVEDPLMILASNNNAADAVDIGFYGLYDTSGSQDLYSGLFRDADDSGKWKLFKDLQVAPGTTVATDGGGYAVGTLVANLEGTATDATNVIAVANNTASETVYPTFVDGTTGSQGIETDTGFSYNPGTGVLTATSFTGSVTGAASEVTANANNTEAATMYPTFVDGATGSQEIETDTGLTYNPNTNTLTTAVFAGNATTATALAAGVTIAATGDITWTSSSFTGATNVTSGAVISDLVIVDGDINANAAIAYTKLAALADGNILVGNGSNVATSVNPSGDVNISNIGAFSIGATKVTGAMLNDDAISGQAELTSGIATTDELLISDGGVLKRIDMSVLYASTATFTNKSIDLGTNTLTGSLAEFNAALQSESFATVGGTETLVGKTLTTPTIVAAGWTNATHVHAGDTTGGTIAASALTGAISGADTVAGGAIQIDSGTDGTGIDIDDTDKFLIDDAGATKYINASQLKTYAGGTSESFAIAMAVAL